MVRLDEELRAAMLARLRASNGFSAEVGGRISDLQPAEFPYAWVGATVSEVVGSDLVDLFATVHVWKSSGQDAATHLTQEIQTVFRDAPPMQGISIVSWTRDYTEVRPDNEHSGHRGLVRFRVRAQLTGDAS